MNRLTNMIDVAGTTKFTYTANGDLATEDGPFASDTVTYGYSASVAHLRTSLTLQQPTGAWTQTYNSGAVTTFQVNNLNQLTNNGGTFTDCTYDANGNLLTEGYAGYPPNYTFAYDDENQLVFAQYNKGYRSTPVSKTYFTYDALGRLRQRHGYYWSSGAWQDNGYVNYVYEGRRVIQERNGSNTPLVAYTRGLDLSGALEGAGGIGGLLARSDGYGGGNWTTNNFYHADGNGNITFMLNSAQAMVAQYRYDAYGKLLSIAGSLASVNVYRFSSKEFLGASGLGLYYYGFRFYDPANQRWLNRDPIQELGGLNLYRFANNDPINNVDRNGDDVYVLRLGGCLNVLAHRLVLIKQPGADCKAVEVNFGISSLPKRWYSPRRYIRKDKISLTPYNVYDIDNSFLIVKHIELTPEEDNILLERINKLKNQRLYIAGLKDCNMVADEIYNRAVGIFYERTNMNTQKP